MRVLLITAYFPPDTGSAAHLFYELGTALVERGHEVWVVTGFPGYHAEGDLSRYRGKLAMREAYDGLSVSRIAVPQLPRHIPIARGIWQFACSASFSLAALRVPKPDVALVYSPPLPLGFTGWKTRMLRGVPFVFNVQDLFPQSVIDLGLLTNKPLIRLFEGLERFVYQRAAHITVHSSGNRDHVVDQKGAQPDQVTVLPNWVDTTFLKPAPKDNEFSREHGLHGKFIVSFAGVIGYSQDLDVVLDAAQRLHDYPEIHFLIVGDGVDKERLEQRAQELGLSNVTFLPMQPRSRYPSILHASDVSLATLHADVQTPVVPSKILSIMAAGRPVVAALDPSGDAPQLIADADCGVALAPEDAEALAEAVLKLYNDPDLCESFGANGRSYAERHLSLEAAAGHYERLFETVIDVPPRKEARSE